MEWSLSKLRKPSEPWLEVRAHGLLQTNQVGLEQRVRGLHVDGEMVGSQAGGRGAMGLIMRHGAGPASWTCDLCPYTGPIVRRVPCWA